MGELLDRINAALASGAGQAPAAPAGSGLLSRVLAAVGGAPAPAPAATPGIPQGATLLGTFPDNGRVYQMPDGTYGAVSAGGSTIDQAAVARIMETGSFAPAVQDSIDQQRIAQNPIAARANEFVRGVPFVGSYIDEAVGLFSPQARDNMRATTEAMQRQNPNETMALGLAGGIAGAIPMALAAAPAIVAAAPRALGARMLAGAGAGAGAGAIEGAVYGAGEGTDAASRRASALMQAGLGGLGGAAAGAVLPALTQLGRVAFERFKASDATVIANALGISRDAAGLIRNALVNEDFAEAGLRIRQAGGDAMLADATPGLSAALDASIATPSAAAATGRAAVNERTRQAGRALTAELDNTLGQPRGEREILDEINDSTKPARAGVYDAAYSTPIDYADAPGRRIESLLPRLPTSVIDDANRLMALRGEESAQIMARIEPLPNGGQRIVYEQMPDVRQLHYILQALDDIGQGPSSVNPFGRPNTYGASVRGLRRELSEALREAVPLFGRAQDLAADTIRRQEAVQMGRAFFRQDTTREDVLRALAGAGADEKRAMREGLRSQIDDVLARVRRTATDGDTETREAMQALRDLSSRDAQTKVRALLGQTEADRLFRQIEETSVAFELRAAIHANSKTAVRTNFQQGVQEAAQGGALRALLRLEPIQASRALAQVLTGESKEAVRLRELGIYEDIARALTQTRGAQAESALRLINRAIQGMPLSMAQAERISAALTSGAVLAGSRGANLLRPPQ